MELIIKRTAVLTATTVFLLEASCHLLFCILREQRSERTPTPDLDRANAPESWASGAIGCYGIVYT
eukprot:m.97925 g.97925  ORF g.97925 m.97925 type:complete len:66 (+) comp12409_c0_seq5:280-477(+)